MHKRRGNSLFSHRSLPHPFVRFVYLVAFILLFFFRPPENLLFRKLLEEPLFQEAFHLQKKLLRIMIITVRIFIGKEV